jgi:hypothetical protein
MKDELSHTRPRLRPFQVTLKMICSILKTVFKQLTIAEIMINSSFNDLSQFNIRKVYFAPKVLVYLLG